jgi:hypothetical protein
VDEEHAAARLEFRHLIERLASASGTPIAGYADYYTHDLTLATVPFDLDSFNYSVEEFYSVLEGDRLDQLRGRQPARSFGSRTPATSPYLPATPCRQPGSGFTSQERRGRSSSHFRCALARKPAPCFSMSGRSQPGPDPRPGTKRPFTTS